MNKVWILTLVCCFVTIIEGPISSRWKECGCHWEPWAPWSACTETCSGGIQQRDRKVWVYDKATNINCGINFTVCATNDMGFETQACNTVCYGGGVYTKYSCSSYYGYCNCQLDKRGSCCEESKHFD